MQWSHYNGSSKVYELGRYYEVGLRDHLSTVPTYLRDSAEIRGGHVIVILTNASNGYHGKRDQILSTE